MFQGGGQAGFWQRKKKISTITAKNTIRDGGNIALCAAYTVDRVNTVDTVDNVDTVDTFDTVDTVDTVDAVDMVYTVDMTHNEESFHTRLSCSNVSMGKTG